MSRNDCAPAEHPRSATDSVLPAAQASEVGGFPAIVESFTVPKAALRACGGVVTLTYACSVTPPVDPGSPIRVGEGKSWFAIVDVRGTPVIIQRFWQPGFEARVVASVDQFPVGLRFE